MGFGIHRATAPALTGAGPLPWLNCTVKHCPGLKLCIMNNKDDTETSQEVSMDPTGLSPNEQDVK